MNKEVKQTWYLRICHYRWKDRQTQGKSIPVRRRIFEWKSTAGSWFNASHQRTVSLYLFPIYAYADGYPVFILRDSEDNRGNIEIAKQWVYESNLFGVGPHDVYHTIINPYIACVQIREPKHTSLIGWIEVNMSLVNHLCLVASNHWIRRRCDYHYIPWSCLVVRRTAEARLRGCRILKTLESSSSDWKSSSSSSNSASALLLEGDREGRLLIPLWFLYAKLSW